MLTYTTWSFFDRAHARPRAIHARGVRKTPGQDDGAAFGCAVCHPRSARGGPAAHRAPGLADEPVHNHYAVSELGPTAVRGAACLPACLPVAACAAAYLPAAESRRSRY
jgi:cytochrome c553